MPVTDLDLSLAALVLRVEAVKPEELDRTELARLNYLRGQLTALTVASRRLLGDSLPFAEEVRLTLGRPLPDSDPALIDRVRQALDRELGGSGSLDERYARFRLQFVVADDRIDRVLADATQVCREAVSAHVTLPADERVDIEFGSSIDWTAHAQYLGGHRTRVQIATRRGHDVAELLHMICHETYAGHHLQHVLIDDELVKRRGWREFQLTPAFGPHLTMSEGAAEAGVDLALPEAARAAIYRNRLLPLAGLPATEAQRLARVETLAATLESQAPPIIADYLDNAASQAATIDTLRTSALLMAPEPFLAFAERHRAAAVVYPIGKAAVLQSVRRAPTNAERWRTLQGIFTVKAFALN